MRHTNNNKKMCLPMFCLAHFFKHPIFLISPYRVPAVTGKSDKLQLEAQESMYYLIIGGHKTEIVHACMQKVRSSSNKEILMRTFMHYSCKITLYMALCFQQDFYKYLIIK